MQTQQKTDTSKATKAATVNNQDGSTATRLTKTKDTSGTVRFDNTNEATALRTIYVSRIAPGIIAATEIEVTIRVIS